MNAEPMYPNLLDSLSFAVSLLSCTNSLMKEVFQRNSHLEHVFLPPCLKYLFSLLFLQTLQVLFSRLSSAIAMLVETSAYIQPSSHCLCSNKGCKRLLYLFLQYATLYLHTLLFL